MAVTLNLRPLREHLIEARETDGRGSAAALAAFKDLFRAAAQSGQPLDQLRRHTADEVERFFAMTVPGPSGHVYWDGPRDFRRNDGRYRKPRRWWWAHKHGPIGPFDDIVIDCGDQACINPEHCLKGRDLSRTRHTREQIIDTIKVAALRLGRPPNSTEWDTMGFAMSSTLIRMRFGSWPDAIRAAGFDYQRGSGNTGTTAAACVEAMRFVRERLGRAPSNGEFRAFAVQLREAGLPASHTTIIAHLGSWDAALERSKPQ